MSKALILFGALLLLLSGLCMAAAPPSPASLAPRGLGRSASDTVLAAILASGSSRKCCKQKHEMCEYDNSQGVPNCAASSDPGDCHTNQNCVEIVTWNWNDICVTSGDTHHHCRLEAGATECLSFLKGVCRSAPCICGTESTDIYTWGTREVCATGSDPCP